MTDFEQVSLEQDRDALEISKASLQMAKLHKKMRLAFFDLLIILLIPLFFNRYQDFDVMNQSLIFDGLLIVSLILFIFISIYHFFFSNHDFLKPGERIKVKWQTELMDLISYMLTLMAIMITLNTFVFSLAMVDGVSMEPTFMNEDDIIINHFFVDYDRFDIVVVKIQEETYYVKRIIGLPGDVVTFTSNAIYINGDLLIESYLDESFTYSPKEVRLGANEYFVMGDNRDDSLDSRVIGPIVSDDIYGKVVFRIRPLDRFGSVN